MDNCGICELLLSSDHWKLDCGDVFHGECLRIFYKETVNTVDTETGRRLRPVCPKCDEQLDYLKLPQGPFICPKDAQRRRKHAETAVISELSNSELPVRLRPIKLARQIVIIEKAEREAALACLLAERERLRALQASCMSQQAPNPPVEQLNCSSQSSVISQPSQADQCVDLETSKISQTSSQSTGKLVIFEPTPSHSSHLQSSQESSVVSTQKSKPLDSQSSQLQSARENLSREGSQLRDVNIEISVARAQLSQMSHETGELFDPANFIPDPFFPNEMDYQIFPVVIFGTWARGRHIHYKIRWSDGTESMEPTIDVEEEAPELLENYRRELRRIATARTRAKQRSGEAPKIPGRGRGRGRSPRGGGPVL